MTLNEYELEGRHRYAEFAAVVRAILETVASSGGQFRVQQVQARAKGVTSLARKLQDRGASDSPHIEREVKDLAGCRVILYTNADVDDFISSGVVLDNFEVDWDRTKFHYPMGEPTARGGFISLNYVAQLKPERLALPEYARFAGLSCEIQIQSILDHAWSEMEHDTIYKPPPAGFGARVMKDVEARMTAIAQKYLRPAGFDFQKIASDVRALERGRKLYESDPIALLQNAADNNERYDLLSEYISHVFPHLDDVLAQADRIRAAMLEIALTARATPPVPRPRFGGTVDGIEGTWIEAKALDVIDELRFASLEAIDATFDALTQLYCGASDDTRRRIERSVEALAKHNLEIWQKAGPLVQERLVAHLKARDFSEDVRLRPLLINVYRFALEPDLTGSTATLNEVTIHQGAVEASSAYLGVRASALDALQKLLVTSTENVEQRAILHALNAASRTPNFGTLSAELLAATYTDTQRVIEFIGNRIDVLPFEVLQAYEHDLLWTFRHTSHVPPPLGSDSTLESLRSALHGDILAFRDRLNALDAFVTYKTLVGFESVFPLDWNDDRSSFERTAAYRRAEVERLAAGVSDENFEEWLGTLRRCAQTKSNDGATFPNFRVFLIELGKRRPELMLRLFDALDKDLDWFVGSMLQGLESGTQQAEIGRRIAAWAEAHEHLFQIIAYFSDTARFDPELFRRAAAAALEDGNERALALSLAVALRRTGEVGRGLLDVFADGFRWFAERSDTGWVTGIWYRPNLNDLFAPLPEALRDEILENLQAAPRIDYHLEQVLSAVVQDRPEKLLGYLHARLAFENDRDHPGYEAVPFRLNKLKERLQDLPDEVLAALRVWFDDDNYLFEYRGGALAERIFPELGSLEEPLIALVRDGDRRDAEFAIKLLNAYRGKAALLPVACAIIDSLEQDDTLLGQLNFALNQTRVVSGEFGFVEALQRRLAEMQPLREGTSSRVQAFAQQRCQQLDLAIKSEQRRAKEALELRKRHWGEA